MIATISGRIARLTAELEARGYLPWGIDTIVEIAERTGTLEHLVALGIIEERDEPALMAAFGEDV